MLLSSSVLHLIHSIGHSPLVILSLIFLRKSLVVYSAILWFKIFGLSSCFDCILQQGVIDPRGLISILVHGTRQRGFISLLFENDKIHVCHWVLLDRDLFF